MANEKMNKTDGAAALGLHSKTPIKQGSGGAVGNDKGNQRPVAQTTSIGGGQKIKQ